jgi:hypothetical protein
MDIFGDFCGLLWTFLQMPNEDRLHGVESRPEQKLWDFSGPCGLLWTFVDFCGLLWTFVDFCGLL